MVQIYDQLYEMVMYCQNLKNQLPTLYFSKYAAFSHLQLNVLVLAHR